MELDPQYVDAVINRYFEVAKIEPIRHDGKTWSEVKKEIPQADAINN